MRILVTGGDGQLAFDCRQVLTENHQVFSLNKSELDITREGLLEEVISSNGIDLLINCAAFTRVDDCETHPETAFKINDQGAGLVAKTCGKLGIRLIHISTDYVFDGRKDIPQPYTETDIPSPVSVYGKSKLSGEVVIQKFCDNPVIIRTAWVYGIHGNNFIKTILKLALQNKTIRVVDDQIGSLTWTYRLARQIEALIPTSVRGIFHASSEGYHSWFEGASYFLKKMEVPVKILPCTTEEFPRPAVRPQNSILENCRLKEAGLDIMRPWQEDIDLFVKKYKDSLLAEAKKGK